MKASLALALSLSLFSFLSPLTAAEEIFYLAGAVKGEKDKALLKVSLDSETGKLGAIAPASPALSSSFFAISPDRKFIYSGSFGGKITALSVGADGSLKIVNEQSGAGSGVCHVQLGGGHLFTANYMSSDMAVYPVKADGSLGERTALVPFTGTGPNTKRQEKSHPHSSFLSGDGKFVYLCDLGSDNIWSFKLDPASGQVAPTEPPSGRTPGGAGPRHLAWSGDQKFAYSINEMGLNVTVFSHDAATGVLTPVQTISTLPEGAPFPEKSNAAEILTHPSGKYVYTSTRGADTLSVFSVKDDGQLSFLENVPAGVKTPRSFDIDPSGRWLVAAGQQDNRIAVLKIDPATGKLSATDQQAEVDSVECVRFFLRK